MNRLFLIVLAGLISLSVIFGLIKWQNPFAVPIVNQLKLIEIQGDISESAFICPKALNYTLLLAFPKGNASNQNSGDIILMQGQTNVLRLTPNTASMNYCKWLDKHGLDGYIIQPGSGTNQWSLSSYLTAGLQYGIRTENGPLGASIWLVYAYPSNWNLPLGIGDLLSDRHNVMREAR